MNIKETNKHIISKQDFEKTLDENVSVKEYNEIISKIDLRFIEICNLFFKKKNTNGCWFDYYEENGFVPKDNLEEIAITGEYIEPPEGFDFSFPTSWLWEENWFQQMQETTAKAKEYKEKQKLKKSLSKIKIEDLKKSIENKLTKEEFALIKFKK